MDKLSICAGQPDNHYLKMVSAKRGLLKSQGGSTIADVDNYASVKMNGYLFSKTIRTNKCELLIHGVKCNSCSTYRATLRVMYNRWLRCSSEDISDSSSHANVRYMNTPEKKQKIAKLKKRAKSAEVELQKLKVKVKELTQNQGEIIDGAFHDDLFGIMQENNEEVKKKYPEGSFQRLFWEEQINAARVKNSRQIRWHPLIIRWCLNLKLLSSAAYHATRTAGFIKLPSERTLRDYTHYFKSKVGFQLEVTRQLQKEAKIEDLPENRRFCALILDEMKIKENLIYDKHDGKIIGFVNLGGINDELLQLERECKGENDRPPIAKHLLVLMIRGIFFKLDFPFVHFGTETVTADLLYPIVWEAVRHIEASGLKVVCITADGMSSNRKFFQLHQSGGDKKVTYKTLNPYAEDRRWIYFISDPPHLIKTTRNCLSHSSFSGTRLMKVSYVLIIYGRYIYIFVLNFLRGMESL